MRRRLWAWVISTVVIVLVLFVGNITLSNTPILGLDLQGGVSVILAPVEPATQSDLIVIRDLIRSQAGEPGHRGRRTSGSRARRSWWTFRA